jgi:hypothetical protein
MRIPIALSRLGAGGSGRRPRSTFVDETHQKLEDKKRDCVSVNDDDSTTTPDNKRKASVDCHVLVQWSELEKLVKEKMACASCGMPVTTFD